MNATQYYTGDGSTATFLITFPLLKRNELKVDVNGVNTSAIVLDSNATHVTITPAPPADSVVKVYRATATTPDSARPVTFQNGSRVRGEDANRIVLYLLHIAQELQDFIGNALTVFSNDATRWNAQDKPIANVGAPLGANDAVRLVDLLSVQQVQGNLPPVSAANNHSTLAVVNGVWTIRNPGNFAQRDLGLQDGAFLDAGTTAGKLIVLDGAAKLPAVDGSQLTNLDTNPSIISLLTGGSGLTSIPTLTARFTSGVISNSTSTTWFTDSSGTVGRLDITSGGAFLSAFNVNPAGGVWFSTNAGANVVTINSAGTYEVTCDVVLGNRDTTVSGDVQVMICDDVGNRFYTGSVTQLGAKSAGALYGEKHIVRQTICLQVSTPLSLCLKANHTSIGGNVWCLGDGTQLTVRRIGN